MRFAVVATVVAAAVSVPLAVSASGPQMSRDEFLNAVRCTAYENARGADLGEAKWRLNAEARRQGAETAALARAEAYSVAREAVISQLAADGAKVGELATACAPAHLAAGGDSRTEA